MEHEAVQQSETASPIYMLSQQAFDLRVCDLGDASLQSGETLCGARLTYATVGELNSTRDNVIVMPTYFTGTHTSYMKLIGAGRPLDPRKYFFVIPNMFGNGCSTSPSNDPSARRGAAYPLISLYDNVVQQARVVFDVIGARSVHLVCGWSLGGMQAYLWGALYGSRVQRLLPYCSAARTSAYNQIFLSGLESALKADPSWQEGRCSVQPKAGLCAFARVYAGWAYSHGFFCDGLYRSLGWPDVAALLGAWEEEHLSIDANDLMTMLRSWASGDISDNPIYCGNFDQALKSIKARTIVVAVSTDRYFPPVDNAFEVSRIDGAALRVVDSDFGHCALSPGRVPAATLELESVLTEILAT